MDKVYKLSDVDIEEFDNASLKIDDTTYHLAKVTKYPDGFNHCVICALAEDCCYYTPNLSVCKVFRDLLRLDYQDIGKLFFN